MNGILTGTTIHLLGMISLFNGISIFIGYSIPNHSETIKPIAGRIREFQSFPGVFIQKHM